MTAPIINGKDGNLAVQGASLPNVNMAITSWFIPMTFGLVVKTTNTSGEIVETVTQITTKGMRQPFTTEDLSIRPEGERSWKWEMMHCLPDIILTTDDIIIFDSVRYRVMMKYDYAIYGYLQYDIVQDYNTT